MSRVELNKSQTKWLEQCLANVFTYDSVFREELSPSLPHEGRGPSNQNWSKLEALVSSFILLYESASTALTSDYSAKENAFPAEIQAQYSAVSLSNPLGDPMNTEEPHMKEYAGLHNH